MDKDIASEGKILTTQINKLRQEVDNLWKEIESGNSLDSKNTFKRIDKKNDRENAARTSYLSDEEIKQLKIKAFTKNISIKNLIDTALKEIMSSNNYQFKAISADGKKRSFAVSQERVKEMKMFLLGFDNITQDKMIYNAVLEAIK